MKTLYKSLPKNMSPHGHKFKAGKWYKAKGELEICKNGFHCSENAIDAMGFVPCEVLAKVEVRGKSIIQDDKQCWEEMKLVKVYKWTKKDSVSLAIFAAELVLKNFEKEYPDDLRPRQTIEAAKKVLRNDTKENRSAAESAASAARSAASAAWLAARSAARSAASAAASAARSAAWSAAESAASAARSAASAAWLAAWSAAESAAWSAAESARSAAWLAASAVLEEIKDKCHAFVLKRAKL